MNASAAEFVPLQFRDWCHDNDGELCCVNDNASLPSRSVHFVEPECDVHNKPTSSKRAKRARVKSAGGNKQASSPTWRPKVDIAELTVQPTTSIDEHIIAQAISQLSHGGNKVYIKGTANSAIASTLQKRPDLFRLQFYMGSSGRLAFQVHLVCAPSVVEACTPKQPSAIVDASSGAAENFITGAVGTRRPGPIGSHERYTKQYAGKVLAPISR